MCGICGAWIPGGVAPEAIDLAMKEMRHRGPDDRGQWADGPVSLGMVRLSIIDLAGGHQPVFNEDGSIAVVFNGEIYNYQELAAELKKKGHQFKTVSDTEVLVHLYEEFGAEMYSRLNGMFAFAIWDSRRHRLSLARDRFGKKPFYYARTRNQGLLFASELKALRPLMRAVGLATEICPQSVYDYLSLGFVPQPTTIFQDVNVLPMGSWLAFDGENANISPCWKPDFSQKQHIPYSEALTRTRELVSEAVRTRLRSDVPLGVFLSGGVDSSVIAYEAARELGGSLRSFTVAMDSADLDESPIAARTAQKLGIQHFILPLHVSPLEEIQRMVRHYDQPYADSSAIPSMAISRLAREYVTVVLNGDGGDEVFGGYRRHLAARLAPLAQWIPNGLDHTMSRVFLGLSRGTRRSAAGFASRFARGARAEWATRYLMWTSDLLLESDKRGIWKGGAMRPTEDWVDTIVPPGLSSLDKQLFGDIHVLLQSDLLVKMDMATMSASIEGRSPLLDYRIIEFTASLPDGYRIHNGRLKSLLRDAYAGLLPNEVIKGKKRGFEAPVQQWLENDLGELIHDTLGSPSAHVRDYLESSFVEDLLQKRICSERNWTGFVYSLLTLELWLRENAQQSSKIMPHSSVGIRT